MAIEIKSIPTLEGEKASFFIKKVERESKNKISSTEVLKMRQAAQKILRKAKI